MAITTADCKQSISRWMADQHDDLKVGTWKRMKKWKTASGEVAREFRSDDHDFHLFVLETNLGLVVSRNMRGGSQQPSDIVGYFQFDDEEFGVAVVSKAFWDEHGHLEDSGESLEGLIPDGFYELSDSYLEHDLEDTDAAKKALIAAGFVEHKLFQQ